jgi:hypothetical protein
MGLSHIRSRLPLRGSRAHRAALFAAGGVLAMFAGACGGEGTGARVIGKLESAVVYGADDRLEYFESSDDAAKQRLAGSVVALAAANELVPTPDGYEIASASWGELLGLCPGEPFAEQPALAFCSGVLVDWDLVLVAGHCAHALPLSETVVLFNYYYREPGVLAIGADDVVHIAKVELEKRDSASSEPRLDYAWLRLAVPQAAPREPAPVYVRPPALALDDGISVIAAGGGVPLKIDDAGSVHDLGEPSLGFFIADSDTSQGASGAGAFDRNLALVGILARGKPDFEPSASGCFTTAREREADAGEEFTYAFRAVEGLCSANPKASALCDTSCGDPCNVGQPPPILIDEGCSQAGHLSPIGARRAGAALPVLALVLGLRRRRVARGKVAQRGA